MRVRPLNLSSLRVRPLGERRSLASADSILVAPDAVPGTMAPDGREAVKLCADAIRRAKTRDAGILLMYGAHLLRNGAALIADEMFGHGWLTHAATNGAGSIHDWEFASLGRSTEVVQENVAQGTFGAWDETGRFIHLALLAGAIQNHGYGASVGRFIVEDGVIIPSAEELEDLARSNLGSPLCPAWLEFAAAIHQHGIAPGPCAVPHRWKHASILASAFRHGVPATVHPGIGYDIVSCHPMFNGAAIGRAAELDFKLFAGAVDNLDGGVVLAIGSAVMAPQVFEKSLSCVHNLRFQNNRGPVTDFDIFVVDLQDGGNWDWASGEPPKDNPAYYLRFCKSFARMGGRMRYVQCDNVAFLHNLLHELRRADP